MGITTFTTALAKVWRDAFGKRQLVKSPRKQQNIYIKKLDIKSTNYILNRSKKELIYEIYC